MSTTYLHDPVVFCPNQSYTPQPNFTPAHRPSPPKLAEGELNPVQRTRTVATLGISALSIKNYQLPITLPPAQFHPSPQPNLLKGAEGEQNPMQPTPTIATPGILTVSRTTDEGVDIPTSCRITNYFSTHGR